MKLKTKNERKDSENKPHYLEFKRELIKGD